MNINFTQAILDVIIFWILTTPHEFAHAWVADRLGDDTPRLEGRVTLNPLAHVDWIGTVILPFVSLTLGGVFLGWGRAVNTNPARLKGGYNGLVAVALAGPGSNVVFAAVLGVLSAFIPSAGDILFQGSIPEPVPGSVQHDPHSSAGRVEIPPGCENSRSLVHGDQQVRLHRAASADVIHGAGTLDVEYQLRRSIRIVQYRQVTRKD